MRLRAIVIVASMLVACAEPVSDEQQLRDLVARAEQAAEARDASELLELVAPHYTGPGGSHREDLFRMAAGYFLVNQQVYVLTRIHSVTLNPDGTASADLAVAMARTPLGDHRLLAQTRADLFRVQLELVRDDDGWLIYLAQSQPAGPGDFL